MRAHWGSRLAFVLAAAGSAIGLGNIWKFPYITGINGGGAFVLVYLVCIFTVGLPILIAELYIGQKAQKNNVEAFTHLKPEHKGWSSIGWLGMVSALLILSFYGVVGGWILDFEVHSIMGAFRMGADQAKIESLLPELFSSTGRKLMFHFIFMVMVTSIVLAGVKNGLERWNKILMPTLLLILLTLFFYATTMPGFSQAMSFLFSPQFSALTPAALLEAVGHSFFTLSLGMGVILVYGSYLSEKEDLLKISFIVALLDTGIALIAGVVIFTIVFSFGLQPGAGPGLVFKTLPVLFSQMQFGQYISILFFLLVTFAALTSAVSILEVVVAYFSESHNWRRKPTTIVAGACIFTVGLLPLFSYSQWQTVFEDKFGFKILGTGNFFDLFDTLTSSYFLPLGGIFISLFLGWALGRPAIEDLLKDYPRFMQTGLLWTTRILAPIAVTGVLIYKIIG